MNIVIVSKFILFRKGLKSLILREIKGAKVAEADSITALRNTFTPGIFMIGFSGLREEQDPYSRIASFRQINPQSRIVIIEEDLDWNIRAALPQLFKIGVLGYLSSETTEETLSACLKAVHDGERFLSQDILQEIFDNLMREKIPSELMQKENSVRGSLTKNEIQVAAMLSEGHRVSFIARKTGRQVSTISTIKRNVMRKTNTENVIMLREYLLKNKMHALR